MSLAVQRYLKRRFGRAPVELDPYVVHWPQGNWVHLEMGKLDLGIVRDSMLNTTNDFQVFAQTFENATEQFKKFSAVYERSNVLDDFKRTNAEWGSGPYGDQP